MHDRREPTDRKAQKKSRSLRNGHKNDQKEQRFADTVQVTETEHAFSRWEKKQAEQGTSRWDRHRNTSSYGEKAHLPIFLSL